MCLPVYRISKQPPADPHYVLLLVTTPPDGKSCHYSHIHFSLDDPLFLPRQSRQAGEAIDAWVADSIAPERPIVVMGFSQGGLLAGEMLRVNPKRYAAAVSFSGFLAHGELPGDDELARLKPPMFYGHGSADDIFPKSELDAMSAFYASHTTLTEKIYPGMTHSINMPELRDVAVFLEHNGFVRPRIW